MDILITNQQDTYEVDIELIRKISQNILEVLKYPDAELSLVIMDDSQIADLNQRYLNRQGPTNVIAFPMLEGDFSHIQSHMLGDVVISIETAMREAEEIQIPPMDRFWQLLIHGILHLIGYDHEISEEAYVQMEAKASSICETLGLRYNG